MASSAQPEEVATQKGQQEARTPAAELGAEMFACQTMEELFDIVMEEAASMNGGLATTALTRLVELSRGRAHKVRGAPALSALAAVLDSESTDLSPKVWPVSFSGLSAVSTLKMVDSKASSTL